MTRHRRFLDTKRFGSLDGLRAISIAAVIWHHTQPTGIPLGWRWIGTYGVTLFFAISGFLITTLLLRERSREGAINLRAFYWRRALRIFPVYFATLLIYIVAVAAIEKDMAAKAAFFHNLRYFATYTSNIFVPLDGRTIFYFAWSLASEEQFYLIWPPILLLAGGPKWAVPILCMVLMALGLREFTFGPSVTFIPGAIVGGALLAFGLHHERSYAVVARLLGRRESIGIATALVLIAILKPGTPPLLTQLMFVVLVGCCVVREDHPAANILRWRPLTCIGSVSYGMYMLHMLCRNVVIRSMPASGSLVAEQLLFPLTFVLALGVATISFRYFESRFLRLKGTLPRSLKAQTSSVPALD